MIAAPPPVPTPEPPAVVEPMPLPDVPAVPPGDVEPTVFGVPTDVLGLIASGATALIAACALYVAWRAAKATIRTQNDQRQTLDLQRQQFESGREADERAQATRVSFYIPGVKTRQRVIKPDGRGATSFSGPNSVRLFNTSDSPVFEVVLWDESPSLRLLHALHFLMPTGGDARNNFMQYEKNYPDTAATMFFIDASRAPWVRLHTGELHRATADEIAIAERFTALIRTSGDDDSPLELPPNEPPPGAQSDRGPDSPTPPDPPADRQSGGEQPPTP